MTLDPRLLQLLVCPHCKGPLRLERTSAAGLDELVCDAQKIAFPVRDGIAVLLESEARSFEGVSTDAAAAAAVQAMRSDAAAPAAATDAPPPQA